MARRGHNLEQLLGELRHNYVDDCRREFGPAYDDVFGPDARDVTDADRRRWLLTIAGDWGMTEQQAAAWVGQNAVGGVTFDEVAWLWHRYSLRHLRERGVRQVNLSEYSAPEVLTTTTVP